MSRRIVTILVGGAVVLLRTTTDGRTGEIEWLQRYHRIIERNPFGLARSNSVRAATRPVADPPPLKLSGITAAGTRVRAYFVAADVDKSPRNFSVAAGSSHGPLKLLTANVESGTVWIQWHEAKFSLSLKTDAPTPEMLSSNQRVEGQDRILAIRASLRRSGRARVDPPVPPE